MHTVAYRPIRCDSERSLEVHVCLPCVQGFPVVEGPWALKTIYWALAGHCSRTKPQLASTPPTTLTLMANGTATAHGGPFAHGQTDD